MIPHCEFMIGGQNLGRSPYVFVYVYKVIPDEMSKDLQPYDPK